MAKNHTVKGSLVASKMVPAITLHWKWQLQHCRYSSWPRRKQEKLSAACPHDGHT